MKRFACARWSCGGRWHWPATVLAGAVAAVMAPAGWQAGAQVAGAPVQGSMTLTPFEWRIEIALDGAMLREIGAVDEGAEFVIRPDDQRAATIAAAARRWLDGAWRAEANGRAIEWKPDRERWVSWHPEQGFITESRVALPVEDARLAIAWVAAPAPPGLPAELDWTWQRFPEHRLPLVPLGIHSDLTSAERALSPARPALNWRRDPGEPAMPPAPPVPPPVPDAGVAVGPATWAAGLLLAGALVLVVLLGRRATGAVSGSGRRRTVVAAAAMALATGAALLLWDRGRMSQAAAPDADEGREIVHALLQGVYRALEYRDEEAAYHALEQVVHGPLLQRLFLEHRQALAMEHLGGAVARVRRLDLTEVQSLAPLPREAAAAPGFAGEAGWTLEAVLSHWGHEHRRRLHYQAGFEIVAIDRQWRLTGLSWQWEAGP